MIQSELILSPNYRFVVASNEVVAKIYLAARGLSVSSTNIKTLLSVLHHKNHPMLAGIAAAVSSYRGKLLEKCRVVEVHNKIPNVLRYELAKVIAGQTVTPTFRANYLALGNGTNVPADTDSTLQNELIR